MAKTLLMIVLFPVHKIMRYIIIIVFIVVLETRQSHVVLAFYVSKPKFACMHRLNLAAKRKTQKEELVHASTESTKSSIILKDSLIT